MSLRDLLEKIEEQRIVLLGLLASFLAGITTLFYYPSLRYGFLFDDLPTITEYIHVRTFDPIGQFFNNSRWISRILNQWTYKHWQTNPYGYRVVDLVMHISIGLMIFFVLVKVCTHLKKESILTKHAYVFSTLVAGLFLLHPTQTQTATYITQMRLEGLVVFFVFLVLLTFVYAVYAMRIFVRYSLYLLSIVLMMFAAGTKEIIIVAPLLIIIVDWFLLAQGEWGSFKRRIPVHLGLIVVMFGTISYLGYTPTPKLIKTLASTELRNNRGNTLTETAAERIKPAVFFFSQFKVIWHYMLIFVKPWSLSFDYEAKLAKGFFTREVLIPLILLLMLAGLCGYWWWLRPDHPVVFGFAWFFIAMLPRASIFPATELICDYKTFLPSFGLLFLFGLGLLYGLVWLGNMAKLASRQEAKIIMVGMLLCGCGIATASRNRVWSSELNFWKDVIVKAPGKSRGYNNYAVALWEAGFADESIANYKKALELDGSYGEPHVNLATIYQGMGHKQEALEHYKKALDTGEVHAQLYHNLGILHLSNGQTDLAEACFKEAVAARSYFTQAWMQLGRLYQVQNRLTAALQAYEQAIKGDRGTDRELLYRYASLHLQLGNYDQALTLFSRQDIYFNDVAFQLACCHYSKHHYAEACPYFRVACERDPNNTMYLYNYGMALMNIGKYQEALELYHKCDNQRETLPFLPLHEVHCLVKIGKKDQAKKELAMLIKTTQHGSVKEEALHFMKENGLA